jgi:hypothetical protein
LHRLYGGKSDVRVYDYAGLNVPMLARMFDRRCRGYEAIGYKMQLPGSAVPGWPADVPLPIDPEWKSQYASSVRRLVRDGVDSPLANLFVDVAAMPSPDAEGANRARSASEAFLYRRLETLAAMTGKFRLTVELPIPFDGWGRMEVDLLCVPSRIACTASPACAAVSCNGIPRRSQRAPTQRVSCSNVEDIDFGDSQINVRHSI